MPYSNNDGFIRRTNTFIRFALNSIYGALTERYDLIFATSTPLTAGIPGIIARLVRRKPFVFEVRDLWPELPEAMGVTTNRFVLWAMRVLEWTSCPSDLRIIGNYSFNLAVQQFDRNGLADQFAIWLEDAAR